jgi:tricorn protease-like protein
VAETAAPNFAQPAPPSQTLYRYDLSTRKEEKVAEGLRDYVVSHNGEKILLHQQNRWTIVPAMAPPKPYGLLTKHVDDVLLEVAMMEVLVR